MMMMTMVMVMMKMRIKMTMNQYKKARDVVKPEASKAEKYLI